MKNHTPWTSATAFTLSDFNHDHEALNELISEKAFQPCNNRQLKSVGWVSPNDTETMVYGTGDLFLLRMRVEERILPPAVIAEYMAKRIEELENKLDRKIRGKEKLDIRDNIVLELTPQAFCKSSYDEVLIMPEANLLFVNATAASRVDRCTAFLRESIGSLPIAPIKTELPPNALFMRWLKKTRKVPVELEIGGTCTLQNEDDVSGVIDVKHQDLSDDEFQALYTTGREVTKIALRWSESVSFTLCEDLTFKKLKFSGLNKETDSQEDLDADGLFEASVQLVGLELNGLVNGLAEIFGGLEKAA